MSHGHIKGKNSHNVSCTISVKDEEWNEIGEWMWKNRYLFHGISVLPFNGGSYTQAPFEDIDVLYYHYLLSKLQTIDLSQVIEVSDRLDHEGEVACSGGACDMIY